MHLGPLQLVSH